MGCGALLWAQIPDLAAYAIPICKLAARGRFCAADDALVLCCSFKSKPIPPIIQHIDCYRLSRASTEAFSSTKKKVRSELSAGYYPWCFRPAGKDKGCDSCE